MNNANCTISDKLNITANSVGIVTSLLIHGGIILLLLLGPVSRIMPSYTQIIQINLEQFDTQSNSSPVQATGQITSSKIDQVPKKINTEVLPKPLPVQKEVLRSSPVIDQKQTLTETHPIAEKSVAIVGGNSKNISSITAENQGSVQPAQTITTRMEGQGIAETKFGENGAPVFIHREMPVYPILAKRLGKEGKVILKLLIDANGKLQNIEVIQPAGFGFTESVVAAVKNSTYLPAYRNGEKVAAKALLPVRFHLQEEK